jgi:hypothetical protein
MFIIQATEDFFKRPIFQRIEERLSKPKKSKISTSKLNLKVPTSTSNYLINLKITTTNHVLKSPDKVRM